MAFSAYIAQRTADFAFEGLLWTLTLAGLAIPVHIFAKKREYLYIVAWAMNTVGIGMGISSYYLDSETTLVIGEMLCAVAISCAVIVLVCLLLYKFPQKKKLLIIVFSVITALLAVATIVFWIINGNVFFSFAFFCLVEAFVWLCICGLTVGVPKRHILRDISFGGFGIAITVGVIVFALITEDGAGLEFLEGAEIFGTTKKKKR